MSNQEQLTIHVDLYDVKGPDEEWAEDWERHTCWRRHITQDGNPRDDSRAAYWAAERWQYGDKWTPGRACSECRRNPKQRPVFTITGDTIHIKSS